MRIVLNKLDMKLLELVMKILEVNNGESVTYHSRYKSFFFLNLNIYENQDVRNFPKSLGKLDL